VEVTQSDGRILVAGPAGKLEMQLNPSVSVSIDEPTRTLTVVARTEEKFDRAIQGMTRNILQNMVIGVVEPYRRGLEIVGVGYNAQVSGKKLTIQLGFASPVEFEIPEGLVVQIPDPTHINISGVDKQMVGQFAAEIRRVKRPEPYKGKGIRYADEVVKKKPGKAFVGTAT
jgi:large subunit ribosomal protein L6